MGDFKKRIVDAIEREFLRDEESFNRVAEDIAHRGCVVIRDRSAVRPYSGDNYVYIWLHLKTKKPFYVGRGINGRWLQLARCKEFLRHIDMGDAVVCKVLDCADERTVSLYERYISYSFSSNGVDLVNKDNNYKHCNDKEREDLSLLVSAISENQLTKAIENAVIDACTFPYLNEYYYLEGGMNRFKTVYGDTFFTDGGNRKRKRVA
jgi:hypothetical protein